MLRAAVLTDRWQETLDHVRVSMASDRRLDWHWQSPDMPAELKAALDKVKDVPVDIDPQFAFADRPQ